MAHKITGATLDGIQGRLSQVSSYHPLDAKTFGDWSVEAGDILTVSREGTDYTSPVHNTKLVWKGAPQLTINSTGTKERPAVATISRKKYGRGGASVRSQERIYKEFTSEDGFLHSAIEISESRMRSEFTDEMYSMRSDFELTASHLYTAFVDEVNSLASEFEVTASHLYTAFVDEANSLASEFEVTASHLYTDFVDEANSLCGDFEVTASHLYADFSDEVNSLRSDFEVTASHLYADFSDEVNSLRSDFEVTASHLYADFTDEVNSLRGDFEVTVSGMYADFSDEVNSLRSDFEVTASHLYADFVDEANSLRGDFEVTASGLYTAFTDETNSLRSSFENTASHLYADFVDETNSLRSDFEVTASGLYTSFVNEANSLASEFETTASHMYTSFVDEANSLRGEFEVTASGLYTAFSDETNSIRSEFEVTTSSMRAEFTDDLSSVRSALQVQANRIGLVVEGTGANAHIKAAQIAASISENGSNAFISADHIALDGSTTLAGWMTVQGGNLVVDGTLVADDISIAGTDGVISTRHMNIYSSGDITFAGGMGQSSVALTYGALSGMIKSSLITGSGNNTVMTLTHVNGETTTISKSNDTLTFKDQEGHTFTFSKAASGGDKLNGTWSGTTLTVEKYITGVDTFSTNISTGFVTNTDVSPNTYHITAYRQDNGAEYPTEIQSARIGYKLGVLQVTPNIVRILQPNGSNYISGTATYTIPSPTVGNITLGSFSAPYTYVGSVTVNGTAYTTAGINATDAYAQGWIGAFGTPGGLELRKSSNSPTYGDTYTVTPYAYATYGAQAKTELSGKAVSITIPTANVTGTWEQYNPSSSFNPFNKYVVRREGTVVLNPVITTTITYRTDTHKYVATTNATDSTRAVFTVESGTEAWNAVTIDSVTATAIGSSEADTGAGTYNKVITANAANGKTLPITIYYGKTTYTTSNNEVHNCVNISEYTAGVGSAVRFARIDIHNLVNSVVCTDNWDYSSNDKHADANMGGVTVTRTIAAKDSGSRNLKTTSLSFIRTTYTNADNETGQRCVNISLGGSVIGRIDIQDVYDAGKTHASVTGTWEQYNPSSSANPYNKYVVRREGTAVLEPVITTTIAYNDTLHEYVATTNASNRPGAIYSVESGTQAYTDGVSYGKANASVTGTWEQYNPSSSANPYNKYVVRREGTVVLNPVITTTITYSASTHKYTATTNASGRSGAIYTAESETEAWSAVTIDSVTATAIGANEADTGAGTYSKVITANAANGKTLPITIYYGKTTYTTSNNEVHNCVNISEYVSGTGAVRFARIDIHNLVNSVVCTNNWDYASNDKHADASNSTLVSKTIAAKDSGSRNLKTATLYYQRTTYTNANNESGQYCVNISLDGVRIGRIDVQEVYNAGVTSGTATGKAAAGVSGTWGEGAGAHILTVQRELTSSTKSLTFNVDADVSYTYNQSTHKYDLTGTALVNNTERAHAVRSTGTDAWTYGYTAGQEAITLDNPRWQNGEPYTGGKTNTAIVMTAGREHQQLSKDVKVTLSQGTWSNNRVDVDIKNASNVSIARINVDATSIARTNYESGRDAVAPFLGSSATTDWDHRITTPITSNGTYYIRARGKDFGGSYGPYIDNTYTDRAIEVRVESGGGSHTVLVTTNASWYMPSSATEEQAKSAAATAMGVAASRLTHISDGKFRNNSWVWFKADCGDSHKYYYTKIT